MLSAVTLEAENGTLSGVTRSSAVGGFSGTGYVTGFTAETDRVSWNFPATPGPYRMLIRFRSPFGQKGFEGSLNGVAFSGMFPQRSSFGVYDAGLVTLREANSMHIGGGWSYYDIDAVLLTPEVPVLPKAVPGVPVNPNATPMARALLARVVEGYGDVTFAGQNDTRDLALIQSLSGRLPAIVEGDFMDYSPSRIAYGANPGRHTENFISLAKNDGAMVSMAWHWNAPTKLVNSGDYPWWRGFYTQGTTFDIAATLANPSGSDYQALIRDIDAIAVQLRKFADADVPVLWRPLHESEGGWFWWGAKGPEPFKELWRLTYDRLTNHHKLDNLIWVLTSENPAWYPGHDVVDIVGVDAYVSDRSDTLSSRWSPLLARFDGIKPLALTEFGGVPDIDAMKQIGVTWAYFVSWNGTYGPSLETPEKVDRIYNSASVITRDENRPLVPLIEPGVVFVASGETLLDTAARTGADPLVKRGPGTLVLAEANTHTGGTFVEEGEVVIRNVAALGGGGLQVRAGARVRLDVGFGQIDLTELQLDPAARLDVGTGGVRIAQGTSDATLRQLLLAGRNGGGWDGATGIVSSHAPAGSNRAVGHATESSGATLLAWAAFGDTNLDGQVNTADLNIILTSGRLGTGLASNWSQGDFDYSGTTNTADINQMLTSDLLNRGPYRVAPPAAEVAVSFTVTNSWPGHLAATVSIRNQSSASIEGWTLEFDLPATITAGNLWGAEIVSVVGTRYRLRHAPWTSTIGAGRAVSFNFNAGGDPSARMSNIVFNDRPVA
jgi:mannan endo-1,4-beta-mannosidase